MKKNKTKRFLQGHKITMKKKINIITINNGNALENIFSLPVLFVYYNCVVPRYAFYG